jgi:hypothetical protein
MLCREDGEAPQDAARVLACCNRDRRQHRADGSRFRILSSFAVFAAQDDVTGGGSCDGPE